MTDDLVCHNGTIWTGTGDTVDALTVRNGRIAALGADRAAGSDVRRVDLRGGFLMPAFGDGHAHPIFAGLERGRLSLTGCTSVAEVVEAVRQYAARHPADPWVVGGGYQPAIAPDGRFDATWLDAALADRPVVLRASDLHTVWCNTEALRRAGITAATPDPRRGRVLRRADGRPLGTLLEQDACDLVLDLVPAPEPAALVRAVREAGEVYAASGVTWVQDAWIEPGNGMVDAYLDVAASGAPLVRVSIALRADPESWRDQRAVMRRERAGVAGAGVGDLVTLRTVKFFADGVIETGTGALLEPYDDDRRSFGIPLWRADGLADAVAAFDGDGFQVHIHAIGDAAVRAALDAIEHASRSNPRWDRRPVIAHAQLVDPSDLPRFARLGVIANFQPLWAQLDPCQVELTIPRIGSGRAGLQYPIRTLLDSGTPVSFGSDWPVSSPKPLDGIRVAVTRQTEDGDPTGGWLPHQRLDVAAALAAYTAGSAYQAFAETDRGTLLPGAAADLVHLDRNPLAVEPAELADLRVEHTWLAGRTTYDAEGHR
ncbi:MAG TPA: amidohydrolase [Pseudonocardiaceae bacterium]|nr:amidohydrolase [Pseudonocardiaceae bacterium]